MSDHPITISVDKFPQLGKIIPGESVKLEMKVTAIGRIFGGTGDNMTFAIDDIELERERRPSVQEVLLSNIAHNTEQTQTKLI